MMVVEVVEGEEEGVLQGAGAGEEGVLQGAGLQLVATRLGLLHLLEQLRLQSQGILRPPLHVPAISTYIPFYKTLPLDFTSSSGISASLEISSVE